jgi:hypothetical protein
MKRFFFSFILLAILSTSCTDYDPGNYLEKSTDSFIASSSFSSNETIVDEIFQHESFRFLLKNQVSINERFRNYIEEISSDDLSEIDLTLFNWQNTQYDFTSEDLLIMLNVLGFNEGDELELTSYLEEIETHIADFSSFVETLALSNDSKIIISELLGAKIVNFLIDDYVYPENGDFEFRSFDCCGGCTLGPRCNPDGACRSYSNCRTQAWANFGFRTLATTTTGFTIGTHIAAGSGGTAWFAPILGGFTGLTVGIIGNGLLLSQALEGCLLQLAQYCKDCHCQ